MFGITTDGWSTGRRAAALESIVETAWELARENGLGGLSLRDLARRLGMAPASLYSYIDSKHGLYDAMFAQGYRALLAREAPAHSDDLRTVLHNGAVFYVQFALEDPVRFQLLSQRTIPGFEPSEQAYALAQEAYDHAYSALTAAVEVTQEDLDLISAVVSGLISQQIANDPGGTRWVRLLDDAVDLLVPRLKQRRKQPAPAGGQTGKKDPA
ncbi:MAG: TetR/AcrR family transcriptional regulator [Friedmanniella sp.]